MATFNAFRKITLTKHIINYGLILRLWVAGWEKATPQLVILDTTHPECICNYGNTYACLLLTTLQIVILAHSATYKII